MKSVSEFSSSTERLPDMLLPDTPKSSSSIGSRLGPHAKAQGSPKLALSNLQVCSDLIERLACERLYTCQLLDGPVLAALQIFGRWQI